MSESCSDLEISILQKSESEAEIKPNLIQDDIIDKNDDFEYVIPDVHEPCNYTQRTVHVNSNQNP